MTATQVLVALMLPPHFDAIGGHRMDTPIVNNSDSTEKTVYIYTLVDPITGLIRYVGKSTNPDVRFRRHLKDAGDGKRDHKSNWILSLLKRGYKPIVNTIEACASNWKEREIYWIAMLRSEGFDLTNSKSGGDGFEPCDETRRKMSDAKKGRTPHNKGKITSPEARLKQSEAAKARFARMTDAEKEAYSAKFKGRIVVGRPGWHHTEEAKAKISEAGKGTHTRLDENAPRKRSGNAPRE
jgi:hypothetical protein